MHQNEYDSMFERVAEAASEYLARSSREAEAARSLLPCLLEWWGRERDASLLPSRHCSLELVRLLLARGLDLCLPEPSAAVKAFSLAAAVADRLETARYGTGSVEEIRARAWSSLGNSLRVLGELRPAAKALRAAAGHLVNAGGDPFLEAELLGFTASLRDSEGQPARGLPLIELARKIYRSAGDRRLEGRVLISKGILLGNAGRYRRSCFWTRKGVALVSLDDEPSLVLGAQHNLLYFLALGGSAREASDLLAEKRPLYVALGDWSLLLNLRWLDGFLARQRGDFKASENFFWMARDGFLEHGLELDAALAMLEIAECYAAQQRWASARSLTAEVIPVLESCGALRQAEGARRLFQAAG
jgi:tetratricopeptide (TPR) repeat protein